MMNEETKYVRWLAPRQSGNSPALQCWVWSPQRAKSRRDDRRFCRPSGTWLHARSGSQRSSAGLFSKDETVSRLANNAISMSRREASWSAPVLWRFEKPPGAVAGLKPGLRNRTGARPPSGAVFRALAENPRARKCSKGSCPYCAQDAGREGAASHARGGRAPNFRIRVKWRFYGKNELKSIGQGSSGE